MLRSESTSKSTKIYDDRKIMVMESAIAGKMKLLLEYMGEFVQV